MNRTSVGALLLLALAGCAGKPNYDVNAYYDLKEQDEILAGIVAHIFTPPLYVKKEDRLKPEHRQYYLSITGKFKISQYFVAKNGIHYFYVVRPAPGKDKRGVGGHFRLGEDFTLSEFREEFVTPALPEEEVTGRCAFLFDEMVKGDLQKYLTMESFVQWPNKISYYDTTACEWKLKPDFENLNAEASPN